ncbi:MAG TPA: HAMP domain-containing sensor histidine kinase [Actinomycetota bacterium]|nr:HAMP domain-containing sensor histidine kinase [Actinomycetota bacterium]
MQVTSKSRGRVSAPPHRRRDRTIQEICHDLRQPAAAILALVSAAETQSDVPDHVRRRLEQIASEARHISTIVGQAAGEGMTFRPMDAGEAAGSVAESLRTSTSADVTVVADPDSTVVADGSALRRALINLLDNAIRAAGANGTVTVRVGTHGDWVHIDVHDSGPGFGAGPVGIAGLGLGIVEWLAGSHGGDLVMLESDLGGTLARLRLPAARTEPGITPVRR